MDLRFWWRVWIQWSDLYSSVSGLKFEGPAIMTTDQSGCTNGYVGANMGVNNLIFSMMALVVIQKTQIAITPLISMEHHRQLHTVAGVVALLC